jgi:predicted nuclease with TOPRIM domain
MGTTAGCKSIEYVQEYCNTKDKFYNMKEEYCDMRDESYNMIDEYQVSHSPFSE